MDWVSRVVLAWRLSNTLGAEFFVEALEEVLPIAPAIFRPSRLRKKQASGRQLVEPRERNPVRLQTSLAGRVWVSIMREEGHFWAEAGRGYATAPTSLGSRTRL